MTRGKLLIPSLMALLLMAGAEAGNAQVANTNVSAAPAARATTTGNKVTNFTAGRRGGGGLAMGRSAMGRGDHDDDHDGYGDDHDGGGDGDGGGDSDGGEGGDGGGDGDD